MNDVLPTGPTSDGLDDHSWGAIKSLVSGLVATRNCTRIVVIGGESSQGIDLSSFPQACLINSANELADRTLDEIVDSSTIVLLFSTLAAELDQLISDAIARWHNTGALILRISGSSIRLRNPFLRKAEFNRFESEVPVEPLVTSLLAPLGILNAPRMVTIYDRSTSTAIASIRSDNFSGDFRPPVAILSCFNEDDIIEETVLDLFGQGCEVIVLDNWSTDGTWQTLQDVAVRRPDALIRLERFPSEPIIESSWREILAKKEEIALEYVDRWIMHYDADELRRSPFPQLNLAQAMFLAQSLGANRIGFSLLDFRPVHAAPIQKGRMEVDLKHFEFASHHTYFDQRKAWIQPRERVDLVTSAGHIANFPNAHDFTYKYWLKHYPIRSAAHGRKKLYVERSARWSSHERLAMDWHVHYNKMSPNDSFIWPADSLFEFNQNNFLDEFGLCIMTNLMDYYSTLIGKRVESNKWASPALNALDSAVSRLETRLTEILESLANLKDGSQLHNELASFHTELEKASIQRHQEFRRLVEARDLTLTEKIFKLERANQNTDAEKNHVVSDLKGSMTEAITAQTELARTAVELKEELIRGFASLKEDSKLRTEISSLRTELETVLLERQDLRRLIESRDLALIENISELQHTKDKADNQLAERNQIVAELEKLKIEASATRDELARTNFERAELSKRVDLLQTEIANWRAERMILGEAFGRLVARLKKPSKLRSIFARRDRELLREGLVDEKWYLGQYPDVIGQDPVVHYLNHGAAEGRNPNPFFNTVEYLRAYPHVAECGMNPLLHFCLHGAAQGLTPWPGKEDFQEKK